MREKILTFIPYIGGAMAIVFILMTLPVIWIRSLFWVQMLATVAVLIGFIRLLEKALTKDD